MTQAHENESSARRNRQRSLILWGLTLASLTLSCASQKPIVSEESVQRSKEAYGRQQQSMESLSQTPAQQAGIAHENATRPVEPEPSERKSSD